MIKIESISSINIHDVARHLSNETAKGNALELKDIVLSLRCSSHTLRKNLKTLQKKEIVKILTVGHQRYYISNYISILEHEINKTCGCGASITYFKNKEIYMCEDCFNVIVNQS